MADEEQLDEKQLLKRFLGRTDLYSPCSSIRIYPIFFNSRHDFSQSNSVVELANINLVAP
ncbi:MAG: hypothetical protein B0A82_12535 [Alkalinema sp. CACIAM 70d]|nr:MAG: hypothetical protein B0A82_12535 [Alkalinema sp. CACIAM 70d]